MLAPPDAAETRAEASAKGSIEHWAKAYVKNPRSAEAALNYARRLRVAGDKQQALLVLRQAAALHTGHRGILSEYGRLLKQAMAHGGHEARVNHNLALVLSLQGKYEEAKRLGARQASAEAVTANVDYVKRMVQLEAKPLVAVPAV